MKEYSIVAILWEDHTRVERGGLPKNPDNFIETTLSVGILIQQTKKVVVLCSDIERYDERDDCTYLVIFKPAIVSLKDYGKIKVRKLRR